MVGVHCFVAAIFVLNPTIFVSIHQISTGTSCMHFPEGLPWLALTQKVRDTGELPASSSSPQPLTTCTCYINAQLPCSQKHRLHSVLLFPQKDEAPWPTVPVDFVTPSLPLLLSLSCLISLLPCVSFTSQINTLYSNPCLTVCSLEKPKLRSLSIP